MASYPGTGTAWTDLSGLNNTVTLVNGTTYSSANGGTMVFDGVNDYGVGAYNSNLDLSTNNFTLEGWFNSTSFSTSQALISKDTYGSNFDWCIFLVDSTNIRLYSNRTVGPNVTATVPTMSTNTWYHVVISSIAGSIRIYLNGVLYITKSLTISNESQYYFTIGATSWNNPDTFMKGKISAIRIYSKGLTNSEVVANFDATKSRFFSSYTTRTSAFAAATGITDTTILNALNTFDTGLISNGLDTKMKALYPFVGGTANTHKFNFMDARDVDAAFRLQFNGGGTHSSTGYKPNGYNAYANTFLIPETQLSLNSNSYGFYSRTEIDGEYYDMGAYSYPRATVMLARFNGSFYALNNDDQYNPSTNSTSLGFFISSRTGDNIKKGYRNNIEIQNSARTSIGLPTYNIYLGGITGWGGFTPREFAFAFMGNGLNAAEIANFTNLVNTLQTSLSRAV
jgi:hypothetical protein